MANLTFTVKIDFNLGGRVVSPGSIKCRLRDVLDDEAAPGQAKAGEIAGFYLASWLGAGSSEFSLCRVADNGTAEVKLACREGDPNTIKFAVATRMASSDSMRCSLLASNFIHRDDLVRYLSDPNRPRLGFTADQPFLKMCDNFTRNAAVLRFMDKGSDLKSFAKLPLKASSLLRLEESNAAVQRLGVAVGSMVDSLAVSPLNAGSQFVQSFTYGHMQDHLLHYGLLGYVFDSMQPPACLQLVLYNAYQAMHSTNLSFDALRAMTDAELVPRFGLPLVTRSTADKLQSVYWPDITLAPTGLGGKVRDTEDIARSLSRLNYEVQNAGKLGPYADAADREGPESLAAAVRSVVESQVRAAKAGDAFSSVRRTPTLDADDCENKALTQQMLARGLLALYRSNKTAKALQASLAREAQRAPGLFAACTEQHHQAMADVLFRLGRMLDSGDWTLSLAVASAKGPSYKEDDPQEGQGLCGHGASIARVRDAATGLYDHYPVEGTTYLTVDVPPPRGYPTELPLTLSSGEVRQFPLEAVATILAQNVNQLVGLSQHAQVLAHLRKDYGASPLSCPFYVSTFFTGLSEGQHGSLGCIPLDTCPSTSFRAGNKPLFGAPLMALSSPSTMAIPLTADLLAEGGDQAKGKELAELIRAQVSEAWGPPLAEQTIRDYLTYLQPVKSPYAPALTADTYAASMRCENTWAFDDPKVTRKAVQVYSALAKRFNEIQAKDPASDGAVASAYGQYCSACLGLSIPLPRSAANFSLSSARNLRRAAEEIGLGAALAACVIKSKMIDARASVAADHYIYMCDLGEGLVHSYRNKLMSK
jgi:hypothetical protein